MSHPLYAKMSGEQNPQPRKQAEPSAPPVRVQLAVKVLDMMQGHQSHGHSCATGEVVPGATLSADEISCKNQALQTLRLYMAGEDHLTEEEKQE